MIRTEQDVCHEGRYPYPDDHVFLVTGVQTKFISGDPILYPKRYIARRAELAMEAYDTTGVGDYGFKAFSCVSLSQLKELRKTINQYASQALVLEDDPDKTVYPLQLWIVVYDRILMNGTMFEIVQAHSSETVVLHAEQSEAKPVTMLSSEQLDATIEQLQITKMGQDLEENYVMDVQGGEIQEQLREIAKKRTADETSKILARRQRIAELKTAGAW